MAVRTRKDFELGGKGAPSRAPVLELLCRCASDTPFLPLPPPGKHKYSITIRTTTRTIDLVAPSEALYRLWIDGMRCYLAYGEALLNESPGEENVQANTNTGAATAAATAASS